MQRPASDAAPRREFGCVAGAAARRTVIGMPSASTSSNVAQRQEADAPATSAIDDLLALGADARFAMLTDLRAGGPGPTIIVHVPLLVRTLRAQTDQDPRFDPEG